MKFDKFNDVHPKGTSKPLIRLINLSIIKRITRSLNFFALGCLYQVELE
jgi:hypothetical protein